jgi:hypothetical protein
MRPKRVRLLSVPVQVLQPVEVQGLVQRFSELGSEEGMIPPPPLFRD